MRKSAGAERFAALGEGEDIRLSGAGVEGGALAWEHGLRGYDAVHLAAALVWRESVGEPVTVATYDRELWRGAQASGLVPWPVEMP